LDRYPDYDLIVGGAGVSGLLAASEAALAGLNVLVLEDDWEIGHPERCDGLVSMNGLMSLGIIPSSKSFQNEIKRVIFHSPGGIQIELKSEKQKVVVLDRRCFDKDLARKATMNGAEINTGVKVESVLEKNNIVNVKAKKDLRSSVYIEAHGISSLIKSKKDGFLQAARYDVQGRWFQEDTLEMYFNNLAYPGFFLWVIPLGNDTAKVGVAGKSINCYRILDKFVKERKLNVINKIGAPIYIGGPLDKFVNGRIIKVGDAAGLTKPSTAGGIYSGGFSGIIAGQAVSKFIKEDDSSTLGMYEEKWNDQFKNEFETISQARKIFERLDNRSIDKLFKAIQTSGILNEISLIGDFDFHSTSIFKILGVKKVLQIAGIVASNEARNFSALMKSFINKK